MRFGDIRSNLAILLAGAGLVVRSGSAYAQRDDLHTAQPERPSVATHAHTVSTGWLEIEIGGEHDRLNGESQGSRLPFAAKIGLAKRVQFSVLGAVERPPGSGLALPDVTLGVKWQFASQMPGIGALAILPTVTLPLDSMSGRTGVGIVGIASRDFGVMALDVNVGYSRTNASDAAPTSHETFWAAAGSGAFNARVGWTAELFGSPRVDIPETRDTIVAVLFGPSFTARPWLVFDTGVIVPVTGPQPRAFYVGAVWNAGRLWASGR